MHAHDRVSVVRGPVSIAPGPEWTSAAATWPVYADSRETECAEGCQADHVHGTRRRAHEEGVYETLMPVTETHLRCGRCDQSVLCVSPAWGESYRWCAADMTSGIVAHLRASHPDVVPS